MSNLLALAAENLAPEKRAGGGPREAPVVRDFADDRARVAALAAIADRAAALPPYAGDDAETDAVFDELLELHASIAASDVSAEAAASADADEARKDRDALERAAGLADAVAALAGDRDKEDGVAAHADRCGTGWSGRWRTYARSRARPWRWRQRWFGRAATRCGTRLT